MNLKYYIDKAVDKLRLNLTLKINQFSKDPLITMKVPGVRFPIYLRKGTTDIEVLEQIYYYKSYNIDFKFEPKVIFDLGANIGLASVYLKNKYPNATIVAVEPEASNYEMLVKNTEQYKDIKCVKAGIWKRTTNLKIIPSRHHWAFTTEEVEYEDKDTVKALSIDELMRMHGVDHIDILKIDIESSEKEVFEENYERWMPHVKVIIVELHDDMKEGCTRSFFKALVNYRFTVFNKGENYVCELLK